MISFFVTSLFVLRNACRPIACKLVDSRYFLLNIPNFSLVHSGLEPRTPETEAVACHKIWERKKPLKIKSFLFCTPYDTKLERDARRFAGFGSDLGFVWKFVNVSTKFYVKTH